MITFLLNYTTKSYAGWNSEIGYTQEACDEWIQLRAVAGSRSISRGSFNHPPQGEEEEEEELKKKNNFQVRIETKGARDVEAYVSVNERKQPVWFPSVPYSPPLNFYRIYQFIIFIYHLYLIYLFINSL